MSFQIDCEIIADFKIALLKDKDFSKEYVILFTYENEQLNAINVHGERFMARLVYDTLRKTVRQTCAKLK